MTSQRACIARGRGPGWDHQTVTTSSLFLESYFRDRSLVMRPVGELSPQTYERLRDGLLACAADEPAAIVVDLGGMQTAIASLLNVFPVVSDRIGDWPGVRLVLAAARHPLRTMLDSSGVSRFVPTYGSVSEALQELDATPPPLQREMTLPCTPESSRWGRHLVGWTCQEWNIPETIPDAVVVTSELIDNMVQHARSEGQLRRRALCIAVSDADPRRPQLRLPGLSAPGGRGLVLVDRLSRTWGTAPCLGGGKAVWAVLTVSPRARIHNLGAHPRQQRS
jgi:STAS domain